jgi:hypothetical protein
MQAAQTERVQPFHDLMETTDRFGTVRFIVVHAETGEQVFRAEVREPEVADRYRSVRPATVGFHSSSSRGEDATSALAIAEAIRRAALKAAEMDRA